MNTIKIITTGVACAALCYIIGRVIGSAIFSYTDLQEANRDYDVWNDAEKILQSWPNTKLPSADAPGTYPS